MPNLSCNLKLHKKDDLYGFRHVKLRALDTDSSYILEQLAYDIIKSVGLLSSEFSYCRVLLNDRELGLFGIVETFKNPWLANSFANGDLKYKNGRLYQDVFSTPQSATRNHTSDLSYYNNITAYADGQYKIKQKAAKSKSNKYKPLVDFTEFIAKAPTNGTAAASSWKNQLDTDSFFRAMADGMWSGNYSTYPGINTSPLMNKIMQVPEFKQQFQDLLVNITKNLVNPVIMNDRINDVVSMIEEDIKWDQTLPRVGKNMLAEMGTAMTNTEIVGDNIPRNIDVDVITDFAKRLNETIPLKYAANGPTGFKSLTGVKEWVQKSSEHILNFYHVSSLTDSTTTSPK